MISAVVNVPFNFLFFLTREAKKANKFDENTRKSFNFDKRAYIIAKKSVFRKVKKSQSRWILSNNLAFDHTFYDFFCFNSFPKSTFVRFAGIQFKANKQVSD